MDKEKMLIIRNDLTKNMPSNILIKELCEYFIEKSKDANNCVGLNVQSILIYLLDYYIEHEYDKE